MYQWRRRGVLDIRCGWKHGIVRVGTIPPCPTQLFPKTRRPPDREIPSNSCSCWQKGAFWDKQICQKYRSFVPYSPQVRLYGTILMSKLSNASRRGVSRGWGVSHTEVPHSSWNVVFCVRILWPIKILNPRLMFNMSGSISAALKLNPRYITQTQTQSQGGTNRLITFTLTPGQWQWTAVCQQYCYVRYRSASE